MLAILPCCIRCVIAYEGQEQHGVFWVLLSRAVIWEGGLIRAAGLTGQQELALYPIM